MITKAIHRLGFPLIWACSLVGLTLFICPSRQALARSVYVAADHHTSQFDAWNINPDGSVAFQATYGLAHATDPAGIGIWVNPADPSEAVLFISSEFSGGVEMVDPVTLTYLGVSTGPSDLAGVDVDNANNIVFAVRRWTNDLYVYSWDPTGKALTQVAQVDLPNCSGAFGIALDSLRGILWVADTAGGRVRAYDINISPWNNISEISAIGFQPSHKPVDIAVDTRRNLVYTVSIIGGAWVPGGTGSHLLSKYDVSTATETTRDMGMAGVGVAVDEASGYVYVTGGAYAGDNITVWDTTSRPFVKIDDTGPIGNPAGIAISNVGYGNLQKSDRLPEGAPVGAGQIMTYDICYDNNEPYDMHNVVLTDDLPTELSFVSASDGGSYDSVAHKITWMIGKIEAFQKKTVQVSARVGFAVPPGTIITNYATIDSDETPPMTDDEETAVSESPLQVLTLPCSDIGMHGATLWGRLLADPEEWGDPYRFNYWKHHTTGVEPVHVTEWMDFEEPSGYPADFGYDVCGLEPGTTYSYWAQFKTPTRTNDWCSGVITFTTLSSPVQILSPNGGECLLGGEESEIVWGADESVDSVVLSYSVDDGQTWDDITTLDNDDANKHHPWTPGILNSTKCLMQIRDAADAGTMDTSDGVFEICDPGIPDVAGMTETQAKSALESRDYTTGRVRYIYLLSTPAGQVAFQWPLAGKPAPAGTAVNLLLSHGAPANDKPTAQTKNASDVTADSAHLWGKISKSGGGTCRYRFYYWTRGDRWLRHTDWEGYAEQGESFSLLVDGLKSGTKYWFWAEARNSAGLSDGWASGVSNFTTSN